MSKKELIGFLLGLLFLFATILFPTPFSNLNQDSWLTLGVMLLMATWWLTECVPVAATALLPIIVVPLLKIGNLREITESYGHPLIFLFLGGFILSIALERSNLHRRIARTVLLITGTQLKWQVAAIMMTTAFLSMWMSNTATSIMMLPIALSILHLLDEDNSNPELASTMLLAVAYSASIGGIATLIGTPPNALMAAYLLETYQIEIGFAKWMAFGLPFSISLLVLTWLWLTRNLKNDEQINASKVRAIFRKELKDMGKLSTQEFRVAIIAICAALGWMFRTLIVEKTGIVISDTSIAIFAALLFFIIPSGKGNGDRLLIWESTKKIPWGVLLLFGGGLALAKIINSSGLADEIGQLVSTLGAGNTTLIIALVIVCIVTLTEVTSNTATSASFIPILGPVAVLMSLNPQTLVFAAAISASCAFMMPVATPPNAIVYGSGRLELRDMIKAGSVLNIISCLLIFLFIKFYLPYVFN